LILDGHGFQVIIQALEQTIEAGLNMVTLLTHISHAPQPLDVTCFKPFKIAFRKINIKFNMAKNNYF
jgi:hypothetical protein